MKSWLMNILEIKYQFPKQKLMEYFRQCYPDMTDYVVPKDFEWFDVDVVDGFKVDETRHFDAKLNAFAQEFADFYNIQDKFITQFLVVEPNKTLPWHADGKPASCCVNSLLTGGTAPIEFRQNSYQYDTALLNIRNEHRVVNGPDMRVMFRIVFYEETTTFETIRDKIHDKTFKI